MCINVSVLAEYQKASDRKSPELPVIGVTPQRLLLLPPMHVVCTSPAVARSQWTHRTFRTLFPGCQPHSALQMTHGQSDGLAVPSTGTRRTPGTSRPSTHTRTSLFEARYVLPAAVPLTNQALRRLGGINGAIRANVKATTNSGQGVWLPKQKSVYLALASGPLTGAPAQTRSPTCARISRRARLEHSDAACAAESRVRGALEYGARSCRIPERHDHRHVAPSRPGRVDTQFRCGVALALAAWTVVPRTAGPRIYLILMSAVDVNVEYNRIITYGRFNLLVKDLWLSQWSRSSPSTIVADRRGDLDSLRLTQMKAKTDANERR
ncbi:hypothetical protein GGX14DRAFT_387618 [Mycena pura]|uniref:Uncharacterized protein n=1 Tax=Mycena pura TaxID=153505 RepID=A0AAD6YLS5_9AGAR|nr:hypothetical protein GGX14DRAFT_387618 [Mycena pura]